MDLARPSGVVFSDSLGLDLLESGVRRRFAQDSAYVAGIAEQDPMTVHVLSGRVTIPERNKRPLSGFKFRLQRLETLPFRELQTRGRFVHRLEVEPADPGSIKLLVRHKQVLPSGRQHRAARMNLRFPTEYQEQGDGNFALADYANVVAVLARAGVRPRWDVDLLLEYPVPPSLGS
jgi:hypothetical protein